MVYYSSLSLNTIEQVKKLDSIFLKLQKQDKKISVACLQVYGIMIGLYVQWGDSDRQNITYRNFNKQISKDLSVLIEKYDSIIEYLNPEIASYCMKQWKLYASQKCKGIFLEDTDFMLLDGYVTRWSHIGLDSWLVTFYKYDGSIMQKDFTFDSEEEAKQQARKELYRITGNILPEDMDI